MADCPVCMDTLKNGSTIKLTCRHLMCRNCVENWLGQAYAGMANFDACPICMTVFANTDGMVGNLQDYIDFTLANLTVVSISGMGLGVDLTDHDIATAV